MTDYKVPYTFVAGTRAKATQVNENFKALIGGLESLDEVKANIEGNSYTNFNVKDPINPSHAATKKYVDDLINDRIGDKGFGIGKSLFEVFHTLSLDTPPGAFSLREGSLLINAYEDYPTFVQALTEKGSGLISDLTNVSESSEYIIESNAGTPLGTVPELRAFSPHSCITVPFTDGIVDIIYLTLPEAITCDFFKVNSYVNKTYNSSDSGLDPDALRAIKQASISILYEEESSIPSSSLSGWFTAINISEESAPTENYRFYENPQKDFEFNRIRIVIDKNFGASALDIGIYPFSVTSNSVRLVPYEQWKYEIDEYGQTGSFVYDEDKDYVYLPKVTGFLSGIQDLWDIGLSSKTFFISDSLHWQDSEDSSSGAADPSRNSVGSVSTGLWIQAYNAIAEEALSNMKYLTNAVLLEERHFNFIPEKYTGWYRVDPDEWRSGDYFVSAWSEIKSAYDSAIAGDSQTVYYRQADLPTTSPSNSYTYSIKKDPSSKMGFVDPEVYDFLKSTIGECKYYTIKSEELENGLTSYYFKTPFSYYDYDAFSEHYQYSPDWSRGVTYNPKIICTASEDGWIRWVCNEDNTTQNLYINDQVVARVRAASSHDACGTAALLQVFKGDTFRSTKSNIAFYPCKGQFYQTINIKEETTSFHCVFLGNEIPQSQQVNMYKRLDSIESIVGNISAGSAEAVQKLALDLSDLQKKVSEDSSRIDTLEESVATMNSDISELQTAVESLPETVDALEARIILAENTVSDISGSVQQDIASLRTDLDTVSDQVEEAVNSVNARIDEEHALIEALVARVSALESSMSEADTVASEILGSEDNT